MAGALGKLRVTTPKRYRRLQAARGVTGKYVHQLRAEKALGHPLPAAAVVHHADGSKRDDAPLVICQDEAYHRLLHMRMRVVFAGGDPNTQRVCSGCGVLKGVTEFHRSLKAGQQKYCKDCSRASMRAWVAANREQHLAGRRRRYREGRSA